MAVERIFVDTNVLVYANWSGAARHADARDKLRALSSEGARLCISRQVLREFLVVVTRPQGDVTPMSVEEAAATADAFGVLFELVEDGPRVGASLLELVSGYQVKGRQIHDANIVATMSVHAIRRLLTANSADFRRYADIIDIEPL